MWYKTRVTQFYEISNNAHDYFDNVDLPEELYFFSSTLTHTHLEIVQEPRLPIVSPSLRQNLDASVGDEQRLLELRRPETVLGDGRPVVRPLQILPRSLADHRLDGEDVAGLHHADGVVLCKEGR